MAGDKEFKIHLKTTGDPSGAKEVTESLEDANREAKDLGKAHSLPFKPSEVKPVEKSIADLTAEVQRLERELEQVPLGGEKFIELGRQAQVARKDLAAAHDQARRLGVLVGRSGNSGLAMLEFSRAFEDAQYGIRGVLNNIPTLLAMLGLGPGLAGVASVAAVAAVELWDAFADSKDAEEGIDVIAEAMEKLAGKLKALRDRRKEIADIPVSDLSAGITEETAALKLQTEGIKYNIEALKERIAQAERLDAILTRSALAEIDAAAAGGSLSADEAAERRADIEREAMQRELARRDDVAKLDEVLASETREAARRELVLAQFRKQSAEEQLRQAKEADQRLREALALRNRIDEARAQVEAADEAVAALGVPEDERNAEGRRRRAEDAESILSGPLQGLFRQSVERLDALFAAQERLAKLESGDTPGDQSVLQLQGEAALDQVGKFTASLAEADAAVNKATAAFQLAEQQSQAALDQQSGQRQARGNEDLANWMTDLQGQRADAAQRSREQIEAVLTAVLGAIGEAAAQPAVQAQAEQVRKLLADGLQASEEGQVSDLLRRLVDRMSTADTRRAVFLQQILEGLSTAASNEQRLENELRDVRSRLQNIEANLGNPNY